MPFRIVLVRPHKPKRGQRATPHTVLFAYIVCLATLFGPGLAAGAGAAADWIATASPALKVRGAASSSPERFEVVRVHHQPRVHHQQTRGLPKHLPKASAQRPRCSPLDWPDWPLKKPLALAEERKPCPWQTKGTPRECTGNLPVGFGEPKDTHQVSTR